MSNFLRLLDPKGWAALIAVVLLLIAVLLLIGRCSRGDEVREARQQADLAVATGKALDKVAKEAPAIRADQEEKQREVDQIAGADQRLPDGFAAELERLRERPRKADDPR
jgi:hypothetical protein